MAQSGYTPILIYGSGTATNVPLAANLTSNSSGVELALNYADGKLYFKNSSGTVTLLASSSATGGTFAAPVVIEGTTTDAALRITQLGTGNALLVEDSSNPDSTPFVIDASGNVGLGTTTPTANLDIEKQGAAATLSVKGEAATTLLGIRASSDANGPVFSGRKTRGTLASPTIVSSGDALSTFDGRGYDGASYITAATIVASVDGTPGTNDMPGRLVFSTTADGASSPTERMRIGSSGGVGIGGADGSNVSLYVRKSITGATTAYGSYQNGVVQSDVTSAAYGARNDASTAASAFTLASYYHFSAQQGTFGAGSTVTNQFGFHAGTSLTGATNNYGFYSNIASGTGRYNFYANGTAENYFGGNTTISVTDNTNAALRITQLGTGNALLVEDSANPDSSPLVVDANGNLIIANLTSVGSYKLEVHAADSLVGYRWNNSSTAGTSIRLNRSRSGTVGTNAIVLSGDTVGNLIFGADDGAAFVPAAQISASVDGTPGTNDMPGRLVFSTTADGASTPTERMRIDSAGGVGIGVSSLTGMTLNVGKNLTGSTSAQQVRVGTTIQSDVTSVAYGVRTQLATAASAFTLGTLNHYTAEQSTIGAGSSVTNQYGFFAHSTLTGATNNYGFYSNIASSTGRWNFYAAGTADNYFAGNVGIGTSSPAVKLAISSTDAVLVPKGTAAQRPTGVSGYLRFNTDNSSFEGYNGTAWAAVGGGNTTTYGMWENANTISANYTITTNNNATSAGPITVNSGVSVTIPSGSRWVIL